MGRATELGEIAARLGRYAVVTLVGVGGVGKTALAVEAAWAEVSAGRAELACYVDLVPCRTDDQVSPNACGGCRPWPFPMRPALRWRQRR